MANNNDRLNNLKLTIQQPSPVSFPFKSILFPWSFFDCQPACNINRSSPSSFYLLCLGRIKCTILIQLDSKRSSITLTASFFIKF